MTRLNPPWKDDAAWQTLSTICAAQHITLRAVGGAVRDALLMREVTDIDAATPQPAQALMDVLQSHGVKVVPTGLAHGTITAVFDTRQIEITTLRRDVATDGRHATIAYTDSWQEDAARRDFTMNALYWDQDGTLHDYFGGAEDALYGRVKFIGDARARIAEDGLRMIRFFRFLATHGEPPADEAALAACNAAHDMVDTLSGERIAREMKKLLQAPNPNLALRLMEENHIAAHIFLQPLRLSTLLRLTMLEHTAAYPVSLWARCAALLQGDKDVVWLSKRWRLSKKEAKNLTALCTLPRISDKDARHTHTAIMRRYGTAFYRDLLLLSAAENGAFDCVPWLALADSFIAPIFPVRADDLLDKGLQGKALGEALLHLESIWEQSDYQMDKQMLISKV